MGLPGFSIKKPVTITMFFAGVILIGYISLTRLPIELLPNFTYGVISIRIEIRGGMPPEEVERLVSKPIEEAVGVVSRLRDLYSISEEGRSETYIYFEPGINMDYALLEVREKFHRIKSKLPEQCEKPVISKYEQKAHPVLIFALTGKGYTPEMLGRLVDEQVKDAILRVNGVANVDVGGRRERKILVEVDQRKIQSLGLPIEKVINILGANNINLLMGDYDSKRQKYILRAIGGFKQMDEIKEVGIMATASRSIIKVKDVAVVKDSFLEADSYSRVNVMPVVSLYIQKESAANTVEVIENIQKELEKLKKNVLPPQIRLIETFNQANSIKEAVRRVTDTLWQGGLLCIVVLWLFLGDIAPTFIISVSMPICCIATFIFMFFMGTTLNVMTLGGLAVGIGMVVDSGTVVLENIDTYKKKGMDHIKAVLVGSEEVTLAIAAGILTTIVVFLPLVFLSKDIFILYKGFALTVTFSLICSFFVAVSLVPMLSAHLKLDSLQAPFKKFVAKRAMKPRPRRYKKSFIVVIRESYRHFLVWCLRKRYLVLIAITVIFLVSAYILMFKIETEFVGGSEQGDFTAFIELPTGAKLDVSDQAVKAMEKILETIPEIKHFSSRVEKWSSKIYVTLVPLGQRTRTAKEIVEDLRTKVGDIEKRYREAFIYFQEAEESETEEIQVDIFGYDYTTLYNIAVDIISRMQSIPGLLDIKMGWRKGRPELELVVDRQIAALYGLTVSDIANSVHAQMRGLRATLFHTEAKEVEVITRLDEKDRRTRDQLRRLTMVSDDGTSAYLEQLVKIDSGLGPSKIFRKNKSRMINVSANRGKYPLGTAAKKIMEVLKDIKLPKDYFYNLGDEYWRMIRNQQEFMGFWPPGSIWISTALIYLVLAAMFESYTDPFIIMFTVPLAFIGVAAALLLAKQTKNIGVLMGMLMLGGIVVNNAIILIDTVNRFRESGHNMYRAIVSAGVKRVRPIMITTLTTLLGLVPMAFDKSSQSQLWAPLAITVIGGLTTSTLLTLFVIPCTYVMFNDFSSLTKNILKVKT